MVKRNLFFILALAVLMLFGGVALRAQETASDKAALELSDTIPVGPDITVGKLDNGLTYYIKYNAKPENREHAHRPYRPHRSARVLVHGA